MLRNAVKSVRKRLGVANRDLGLSFTIIYEDPRALSFCTRSLEQGTDSGHADHLREVDHLVKDLSLCSKLSRSFGPVGTSETNWLLRIKVYECQSLMFSRVKANVENAVYLLTQIFERPQHRNYVPALLALSQALVIQKQVTGFHLGDTASAAPAWKARA